MGSTGLTTDDQDGMPAPERQHHRRDFPPHPINAVMVCKGQAYGPGGQPVCLTHASVAKPLQPCAADDDRRLSAHGCLQGTTQPWDLGPPPQKRACAVWGQVLCPWGMFALATVAAVVVSVLL